MDWIAEAKKRSNDRETDGAIALALAKPIRQVRDALDHSALGDPVATHTQYDDPGEPGSTPWEQLLCDDPDGHSICGVNTLTCSGNVSGDDIIRHYHGDDPRCVFTGEPTQQLFAADANPQNFLVSNMVPATAEQIHLHYSETIPAQHRQLFRLGCFEVTILIEHRADRLTGQVIGSDYLARLVDQYLGPYLSLHDVEAVLDQILPVGMSPTLFAGAVWAWRQLETRGLLKGLAQLELRHVDAIDQTASVNKMVVLHQARQMMQREFNKRNVVVPTAQVDPRVLQNAPGKGPTPQQLVRL